MLAAAAAAPAAPADALARGSAAALQAIRAHLAVPLLGAAPESSSSALDGPPAGSAPASDAAELSESPSHQAAATSDAGGAVHVGVAAAHTGGAAREAGSSPRRGRSCGGAVAPGEALGKAAQWLVVLVMAAARMRLPPQGLALMADLAQLLYCRAGPAAGAAPNLAQLRT